MRKSLVRWTLRILLLAGICAAAFTAEVRTAPVAKAATCDIAAWYKVAGPADGPTINESKCGRGSTRTKTLTMASSVGCCTARLTGRRTVGPVATSSPQS